MAFEGPRPFAEAHARHLNGDKTDNRAINLKWGTARENYDDRALHGRNRPGEENNKAKLTEKEVYEIRESSEPLKVLAERYGIVKSNVHFIRKRQTWKHLPERRPD